MRNKLAALLLCLSLIFSICLLSGCAIVDLLSGTTNENPDDGKEPDDGKDDGKEPDDGIKPEPCEHRDADDDGKCDVCGADYDDGDEPELCNHRDADDDKKCDSCGADYTDVCDVHSDNDDNGRCDVCHRPFDDGCDDHRDADDDSACDICSSVFTDECDSYLDADSDGKCDNCSMEYSGSSHSPLDGKRIIFIGNSYTYYGQTVLRKDQSVLTQAARLHDRGFFYQLCRANGADVDVTNWTFGGHSIKHLFGGNCTADRGCDGVDHKAYLTDRAYDYVMIQPSLSASSSASFLEDMETVTSFFREANPDVKFAVLVPYAAYGVYGSVINLAKEFLDALKTVAAMGVTVVDWGGLVMDILEGEVTVPGSELDYVKNTFIVAKSANDGYHPNMLSGYITTLMTYCALTGAPAELQPHDFCNKGFLRPNGSDEDSFSFDKFIAEYYTYGGATTNFPEVFASDIAGVKELVAAHLKTKAYMSYNYTAEEELTFDEKLDVTLSAALDKVDYCIQNYAGKFPGAFSNGFIYKTGSNTGGWVQGFWPGVLWHAYELSGDERYAALAAEHIESFYVRIDEKLGTNNHDMGFLYTPSCVAAYKLTGDQTARLAAIMAADNLLTRYHEDAGFIQAWGTLGDEAEYRLIIDCLMNIPLLYWASEVTGDEKYASAATAHLNSTLATIYREDGSTYHTYYFDPETKLPSHGATKQGYSDESTWSRGQAWAIYGPAIAYGYIESASALEHFKAAANCFIENLPSDYIPYWDFTYGEGSDEPRDASAAAIAICGLLEGCKYLDESDPDRARYMDAAEKMMEALIDNYFTGSKRIMAVEPDANGLLTGATQSRMTNKGVEEMTPYSDYFFIEALHRFIKLENGEEWNTYW